MMDKILNIIAAIPIFADMTPEQLEHIRQISVDHRVAKGQLLFSEGDRGDGFYVVVSGQVKVFKLSPEGKEQTLHVFGPGEPLGQVAVFSGRSFPANAQALVRTRLLFFPKKAFVNLIAEDPDLALKMLAVLSMRLREFTIQIENLSLKEVPGRLASYLLVLTREQKNEEQVELPVSKGQLASLLGTIPETLSRIFNRMASLQIISVDGRTIHIKDRFALADLYETGRLVE